MKFQSIKIASAVALLVSQMGAVQTLMAEGEIVENTTINVIDQVFAAAISNRPAMTSEIVDRLREGVKAKGLNGWESELTMMLNKVSDEAFLAAYNAGDNYKAVTAAMAGISFDKTVLVNNLNSGNGAPSALLGSDDKDFVYTPITPCRIVDTRQGGGKILAGTSRGFYAHTGVGTADGGNLSGQGGSPCTLPNGNSDKYGGYILNITITQPEVTGHIRIYPEGEALPPVSIMNFTPYQTIANSVLTKSGFSMGEDFRIYSSVNTHVVVDIMGYFDKPERTLPDTYITKSAPVTILKGGNQAQTNSPSCPAEYRLTSGGFDTAHTFVHMVRSRPATTNAGANVAVDQWTCLGKNNSDTTDSTITCYGICQRIPGK